MSTLRAVVFDLDGTLIDSAPDLRAAANAILAKEGRRSLGLEEIRGMIGDGTAKLVERAFAATGTVPADIGPYFDRFMAIYERAASVLTRPYPGVEPTLDRLKADGLRLGICTNKPARATEAALSGLRLAGWFETVVGGDSVGVRKPDPRMLLAVLDGLRVTAAEAVMVGDNEHDVATARAAGVPMVLVSYGYARVPVEELAADRLIHRFEELPAALASL